MPNSNNNQNSGSGAKTAVTFGLGALAGALAAGAAWYFSEGQPQARAHTYQSNHPVNRAQQPAPTPSNDTDKDEKDGSVKMCEVCFVDFEELKQCGVQIVATPCGHIYCRDCILGSLAVKPECPHCRNPVQETGLRRLYF